MLEMDGPLLLKLQTLHDRNLPIIATANAMQADQISASKPEWTTTSASLSFGATFSTPPQGVDGESRG